jgi:ACS family tartrate transporter-like MFS transporter
MSADLRLSTLKKVNWRLLPITMLLFFMSLLDRTNISFAALEMNKDLGLSLAQYGLAASIFYVGYFLFEIPSNFALARVGARIWLTRIMVTWGLIVIANGFVKAAPRFTLYDFSWVLRKRGCFPGCCFIYRCGCRRISAAALMRPCSRRRLSPMRWAGHSPHG